MAPRIGFPAKEAKEAEGLGPDPGRALHFTAAQLYWSMPGLKDMTMTTDEVIARYLYCLEKMGDVGLKQNFKGPFEDKFKQLDADLDKYRKM